MRRGGFIGNVPISGAGTFSLSLAAMPAGAYAALKIKVQYTGATSSAGAFSLIQSGVPNDDVDLVLNDALGFIQIFLDRESQLADNSLTAADLRTALMVLNGSIDVQVIGQNIPASGTTETLTIALDVPLSIDRYLVPDGRIFAQGSLRFANGGQVLTSVNKTANSTGLALAAGTLKYTGLTVSVIAIPIEGAASLVGPAYYARKVQGYPNVIPYQAKQFLYVGVNGSAYGTTYAQQGINTQGQQEVALNSPDDQASSYLVDHPLWGQGVDVSYRYTPIFWVSRNMQFEAFPPPMNSRVQIPAASNLTALEIEAVPAPAGVQASVAAQVNGGGAVASAHPTPPSLAPGSSVSAGAASMLPVSFHSPSSAPAGSTLHGSSAAVASVATARNAARLAPVSGPSSPATASSKPLVSSRASAFGGR